MLRSLVKENSIYKNLDYLSKGQEEQELGITSVIDEKLKILESELQGKEFQGLRILGCSKTYRIANNCCGTKEVKALKQVIY